MPKYHCTRVEHRTELYRYEDEATVEIPQEMVDKYGSPIAALQAMDEDISSDIEWSNVSDDRTDTTDIQTEYEEPQLLEDN